MSAKCKVVKWNKVREIITNKKYSGEKSAYWEWVRAHNPVDENGLVQEPFTANPDNLPELEPVERGTLNRRIMRAVVQAAKLSVQEKRVLQAIGLNGRTEEETASLLNISRLNVRRCLLRAKKKCEKLYAAKLAHAVYISEGH